MRLESIVRVQFRLRWGILAALLCLLVVAGWQARRLEFDFSPQRVFVSTDEEYRFLERLHRVFGRDDSRLLVHVRAQDVFSREAVDYLFGLHDALVAIDGVAAVDDMANAVVVRGGSLAPTLLMPRDSDDLEAVRSLALSQPLFAGRLVTADSGATLISVSIADDRMDYDALAPIVNAVLTTVESRRRPPGLYAEVIGIPLARVLLVDRLTADQLSFLPLCLVLFFVVLWILFRDLRAVLVPLAAVLVSLIFTAALLAATGEPINIINNVLPTLLFVIGVSDAIHLVARYRQELVARVEQSRALEITVSRLGVACLLTSVTTAVGFASLAVSRLDILRRFGLYAAAGVLICYVITVVLVPIVLSYLAPALGGRSRSVNARIERIATLTAAFATRRRGVVLVAAAILVAGSLALASRVEVENSLFDSFPDDDPLVEANRQLEADFPGIIPFTIAVEWEPGTEVLSPKVLRYLAELSHFLESRDEIGGVLSIVDVLEELNAATHLGDPDWRRLPQSSEEAQRLLAILEVTDSASLARLYSAEERLLRITGTTGDIGSSALGRVAEVIEARLRADSGRQRELGLRCVLSGDGPVGSGAVDRLIGDMFRSLFVAFAVIFVIMIAVLGSVRTAAISMILNVFPLVLTLGVMGLIGLDLQVPTVIVFSVALGLAVDDTIHFMVRFKEEWRAETTSDLDSRYRVSIEKTLRGTGQAIFATSVLLAAGYSVLLFSRFPITQKFGIGMLITVTGALIGDLLILPACLAAFQPMRVADGDQPDPGTR